MKFISLIKKIHLLDHVLIYFSLLLKKRFLATIILVLIFSGQSKAEDMKLSDREFSVVEKDNKKGLANQKGELVIPVQYDDLGWSKGLPMVINNVVGYKKDNLWGLINIKNEKIVDPIFATITPFNQKYIIASKLGRYSNDLFFGIIDTNGNTQVSFKYNNLEINSDYLIASVKKDKISYGLITWKDKIVLPFQYQIIYPIGLDKFSVIDFKAHAAFYNGKLEELSGFLYDSIYALNQDYQVIEKGGKVGLINQEGKVLLPTQYKKITINQDQSLNTLSYPTWSLYNHKNQRLNSLSYDNVSPIGKDVLKAMVKDNEVLIDLKGNQITDLSGLQIGTFQDQYALLYKDRKIGLIDKNGEVILDPVYDTVKIEDNFFYIGRVRGKKIFWSILNHDKDTINAPEYHDVVSLDPYFFGVKNNNYWGLIDKYGQKVTSCKFDSLQLLSDGNIKVSFLDQQGIIGSQGEWLVMPQPGEISYLGHDTYISSSRFCNSLINQAGKQIYCTSNQLKKRVHDILEIRQDGKLGLLDFRGNVLLDARYDHISTLQDDTIYTFSKEGLFGIMTKSGNILTEDREFQDLYTISENFIGVKMNDKYGFVDPNGDLRIANRYDSIRPYSEGFAAVQLLGRWGFVDKIERLKVQPLYDQVWPFENGLAIVQKNDKYGLINQQGVEVLNIGFDSLYRTPNNRFISFKHDEYGIIGQDGQEMVFPKYDQVTDLKNGYVIIRRGERYGLVTNDGVSVIPLMFRMIKYDPYNELYLVAEKPQWKTLPKEDILK
ncbi:MAG: WG repeat-containing protein [Candidatus Cyclobacteriaceae bacterium M3_2C_046]